MPEVDWIEYEGVVGKEKPFLVKENGSAKNITGWTVSLRVWAEASGTLLFSGTCDHVVSVSGTCKYVFVSGDISIGDKGDYLSQLILTSGNDVIPTETKKLKIKEGSPAIP